VGSVFVIGSPPLFSLQHGRKGGELTL